MGVYIKGMSKPKCCYDCWDLDDDGDYPRCRITDEQRGYNFNTRERVMDRCPLIEVAEPHGDLVDISLMSERAKYWGVGFNGISLHDLLQEFMPFAQIATVIEAEGER